MQLQFENPYASPRDFEIAIAVPTPRRTDLLRGAAMAVIWQGAGYAAILFIALAVRVIFDYRTPLAQRIPAAIGFLPYFSGPALFFGAFFALAAMANYSPAMRMSFGRTVLYILASLIPWMSVLLTFSYFARWPFRFDPLSYLATPTGQWWVAAWFLIGPIGFTAYLLWRRIRAADSQ